MTDLLIALGVLAAYIVLGWLTLVMIGAIRK